MSAVIAINASNTTATPAAALTRGRYDEIGRLTLADGSTVSAATIIATFKTVLPEQFSDFDRKGRGDSLTLDLYAYDEEQKVAVVQIRHAFRRAAKHFLNVRKDYVLVGINETGTLFRHPVSAHAIHAGIRKDPTNPLAAVRAAQRWMWNVTAAQLDAGIRQGDVLMVPVRNKPAGCEAIEASVVLVGGTHEVHATAFAKDRKGVVYAMGPTIRHTKGQHCTTYGDGDGWHSIRVGREASTWNWGVRLGD